MDSYRVEANAALKMAMDDADATVEPVPPGGGGGKGEADIDKLSAIIKTFNDLFGNIEWKDKDKIRKVIAEEIPARVAQDKAYQNAQANSDKQNAKLEHDKALNRVVLELLSDHTELFKQFSDNPNFKRWLTDTVFDATYHRGAMPPKAPPQPGCRLDRTSLCKELADLLRPATAEELSLRPYHVHQCFHAVGHGTFMTGVVIGKDENAFSWVYDCGSKSSNAMGSALARTASWSVWPDRINMLVLSHFDDDHVNGLQEDLLKQCEVDFLILPFSEWQQRVRDVAVGGLKGISASTAQLQLSPITWLQSKDLTAKVGTLLLVRGGSSEQQEDREPMRLPTGTNPNELGGDRQRQDSLEQRELRMVASTHVAGPTVQVMQHGTPVHPDGFPMEFMFYNAEVSGKDLDIIKTAHTGDLISKRSRLPLHEVRKEIRSGDIRSWARYAIVFMAFGLEG